MEQKHVNEHSGAEQAMAKSTQPMKTIFNKPNLVKSKAFDDKCHVEHLKPFSVYTRMLTRDSETDVLDSNCSNPFVNLKIEVLNFSSRKRRLDDSCLDHTYGTPPKKPYSPKAVSPDLGCVIDLYTPPKESQGCTSTMSEPALLDGTKAIRSQNKGTVKSQLPFEHVGSGPSVESAAEKERVTKQCRFKSTPKISAPLTENPSLVINPAFDLDVVDILCLSPIRTSSPERFSEFVDSYRCSSSSMLQNDPVLIPHPTQGQAVGEDENEEWRGKELKKGADVNIQEEDDSGYFSTSFRQVRKASRKVSPPSSPLLPQVTSCPLVWRSNREVRGDGPRPAEPGLNKQIGACEQYISLTVDGSLSSGALFPVDGDFEVKSVVVVPTGQAPSNNTAVPPQPQRRLLKPSSQATLKSSRTSWTQREGRERNRERRKLRPMVFAREEDWTQEKNTYVNSVIQHMKENTGSDVMTELLNLMTDVADQGGDTTGGQWQHPSDLTRRNYQRRFGNTMPTMSLSEWKIHNERNHRRFAKVPKIFQRSKVL